MTPAGETPGETVEMVAARASRVLGRVWRHLDHGDVVLVCASGVRASDAQQRLTGAGFTEAAVLSGGIGSYAQAGGDVVRRGTGWGM